MAEQDFHGSWCQDYTKACSQCLERFAEWKRQDRAMVVPARQQGKTLALAVKRVRRVAEGGHINTTYGLPVGESLEAFRADLLRILG